MSSIFKSQEYKDELFSDFMDNHLEDLRIKFCKLQDDLFYEFCKEEHRKFGDEE